MVSNETLESLDAAVRRAAAADCLVETLTLIGEYVAKVEQRIRSLLADSDELPALQNRTVLLFDFATAMFSASRQYTAAELAQVQLLAGYRNSTTSSHRFGTQA
jgi:hypothetical protein